MDGPMDKPPRPGQIEGPFPAMDMVKIDAHGQTFVSCLRGIFLVPDFLFIQVYYCIYLIDEKLRGSEKLYDLSITI